jgi:hypothetical protein
MRTKRGRLIGAVEPTEEAAPTHAVPLLDGFQQGNTECGRQDERDQNRKRHCTDEGDRELPIDDADRATEEGPGLGGRGATLCSPRDDDTFEIAPDGGVKNVVVYLADIKAGKKMEGEMKPVLDQKECHYVPHVQIVPLHGILQVKSSDPLLHNVHSFLNGSTVINFAMPPQPGLVLTKKLDKPGGEQLKCDVHNFMTGGLFVTSNPYAALTGDDGTFEIKDVPAGSYTIATWHQAAGPLSEPITVSAGGTATFNGKVRQPRGAASVGGASAKSAEGMK